MLSPDLQRRLAKGERDAFQTLYNQYGHGIYHNAMSTLNDEEKAKQVVKASFLALHNAIRSSNAPLDADRVLEDATEEAIAGLAPKQAAATPGERPSCETQSPAKRAAASYEDPFDSYVSKQCTEDDNQDTYAAPEETPLPHQKRRGKTNRGTDEADALLERVRARVPADSAAAPEQEIPLSKHSKLGNAVLSLFLVVFLLLFLWILAGILMDFELLPRLDLGYAWFNANVFRLFSL